MRKHFPGKYDVLIQAEVERDLYEERGLGVLFSRGCLGTRYGDDRRRYFRKVRVITPLVAFKLSISWRS